MALTVTQYGFYSSTAAMRRPGGLVIPPRLLEKGNRIGTLPRSADSETVLLANVIWRILLECASLLSYSFTAYLWPLGTETDFALRRELTEGRSP